MAKPSSRRKKSRNKDPLDGIEIPVIPLPKPKRPAVIEPVFRELLSSLDAESVRRNARRNGETPFGYVIDYIKDMYGYSKTEAWQTAEAVCRHLNLGN